MIRAIILLLCMGFPAVYPRAVISEKVLICGVCKNVSETRLPFSIKIVEQIGALFEDYRVIIYENNSTDYTPTRLYKWEKEKSQGFLSKRTM